LREPLVRVDNGAHASILGRMCGINNLRHRGRGGRASAAARAFYFSNWAQKAAPRPQHAGDLGEGALAVEPVDDLAANTASTEASASGISSASSEHLGLGTEHREQAAHRLGRLYGNHTAERGDEQARELARARS